MHLYKLVANTTSPDTGPVSGMQCRINFWLWAVACIFCTLLETHSTTSSCTIVTMSRIGSLSSVLRTSRASGSTISRRFASSSTTSPTFRNRWVTLASIGVCPSLLRPFNGIMRLSKTDIRLLESSHTPSFDLLYYSMNSLRNRNRKPRLLR